MPTSAADFRSQEGHGARNRGERLVVIANPNAGGGRAGREREEIERAVDRAFEQAEVLWTQRPGHATELARVAALGGADIVAALGGDGTCNEVVNGLMGAEGAVSPRSVFATLPFGTGGDLVRTLRVPRSLPEALWVASTGTTVHVDVGEVVFDAGARHWFINVSGAGANADVCMRANRSKKRFGGTVTFLGAILATVREFEPRQTTWRWRNGQVWSEATLDCLGAFVANAHYCGAGLYVGKGGSMADGRFELTLIPRLSVGGALVALGHSRTGNLEKIPGAVVVKAEEVEMNGDLVVETDGEPRSAGPARWRLLPRALQVRGAWSAPPVQI
jgi:diacylglycerol kinase (ATP)